jgi:hypothetical protein
MQTEEDLQQKLIDFIPPVIAAIFKEHNINLELAKSCPSFYFVDSSKYGEQIHKIDPNEDYTHEDKYTGMGKFIAKDNRYHIVINSLLLQSLAESDFNNITSKYTIIHELGHWINEILTPEFRSKDKPKSIVSLREGSEYLISVAIDEYMTNNYINFLFSESECKEILINNTLYEDLDNIYSNISDPFDLYTRFWNNPNSIFKNMIANIPFFLKSGGFKEAKILEIINIKSIISILSKTNIEINIILNHLIHIFNLIVSDYNSDNPSILQKYIL